MKLIDYFCSNRAVEINWFQKSSAEWVTIGFKIDPWKDFMVTCEENKSAMIFQADNMFLDGRSAQVQQISEFDLNIKYKILDNFKVFKCIKEYNDRNQH
jgi:hypothetical protein